MTVGVCVSICSQADELNKCETSRDELKINIILNTHTHTQYSIAIHIILLFST